MDGYVIDSKVVAHDNVNTDSSIHSYINMATKQPFTSRRETLRG